MEERRCPSCGSLLTSGELFCGKCGTKIEPIDVPENPDNNKKNSHVAVIVIIAAAVVLAVAGIVIALVVSNGNPAAKVEESETTAESTATPTPTPSPTPSPSPTPTPTPTPDPTDQLYYVGDIVDVDGQQIEMGVTDEVNDSGERCIIAVFGIINTSSDSFYVSYYDFDCYADGLACSHHILWDYDITSYDELAANVSPGNGVAGYVCFEVPEDAEEIIIEYEYDWLNGKRLKFVYEGPMVADN